MSITYGPPPVRFDIAGVTAAIDRAAASLKDDERGSLTVQLNSSGMGAGLVVRGPFRTSLLATVTRPVAGGWNWSASGRIAFAVEPDGYRGLDGFYHALRLNPPASPAVPPTVREMYWLFRGQGNGRFAAGLKAVAAMQGAEVRLAK